MNQRDESTIVEVDGKSRRLTQPVGTTWADFFGHALSYRPFVDALQDSDLKLGPMARKE